MIAGDIAVGIAVYAAALKADRLRREEEARRREGEQQRRERAARAEHVQKRRVGELGKILEELADLERLRGLVSTLRSQLGSESAGRVEAFVKFADERLAAREAAFSADGLEARFEGDRIFGDDDDHDFYPSRYY